MYIKNSYYFKDKEIAKDYPRINLPSNFAYIIRDK